MTANITIEATATAAKRTITVTNGDAGVGTSGEIFTVNAAPSVESTSPSSRGQGATSQTVTIKGKNFVSGATSSFGAGITVESTSFVSSTELSAKVSVESGASTGVRTVTVTNPDEGVGSKAAAFTVNAAPSVTSTSPSSRGQGASKQTIKITGANFVSGATSSFGAGITVESTTFVSATELSAKVSVEAGASTGVRTVTVTNPDEGVGSKAAAFTVNAAPSVTSASPSSRGQGATSQTIKITGTGFVSGATSSFGAGVTVESTSFVSSTELSAKVSVEAGASTGSRTVSVTNPDEGVGSKASAFTVNAAPSVESTSPSSRGQGATSQTITIKGKNFVSGATSSFGAGITVNSTTFKSSTELTANVTVEAGASTGARNVTVTNPDAGVGTGNEAFTVNAAPTVESTSPSSRGQGASKQTITIKGTNFVSGATSSFGAGITVESTSFVSSTELSAKVSVEAGASTGSRTVSVTNPDEGVGSKASAFTVNAKPTVTAASPSSRGQGAANQTIKITGTGFSSGATLAASFSGTGITVNSTSFVSATEVTANITIEATATAAKRTITVTNGDAGVGTSGEIFTVNAGPNVETVSPSSGDLGGTENVTIKGTSFVSGATSSFGAGVTVNSTTFVSATELTAKITIEAAAATGTRTVTVTNPDAGVDTLAGAFTVNAAPTVTSTSPNSRGQGATSQNIAIKGTNFESGTGLAASFSGTGITVNSTTFVSSTEVTANITVASGATTGLHNVTVTNPDTTTATLNNAFTVNAAPTVESTSPSSRGQGASKQTITIKGTNFVSGATSSFGAGITVESTSFVSSTELSAKVSVEAGASTGSRTVSVTNPDEGVGSKASAFTVNAKPTVTAASPSSRGQGAANQTIKITGTGFSSGATLAASFSGTGITVNSTSFVSATEVTANITIEATATAAKRTITVTNGDAGVGTSGEIFTVNAGPNVETVSPSSGDLGGTENVTIKGTSFVSGATSSFGAGVTVNSTTFVSATELTAKITIEAAAATGTRTVTVTNPDAGVDTLAGAFTVNAAPTVTSTSPNSRGQGATSQNIAIKGTNFESGTGLAASFSGTGITVNSTTFVSSTEVTANITVASGATTGLHNVTVTNPDTTTATLNNAFTVNAGPTITSPTKAAPITTGHGGEAKNAPITGTGFAATPTISLSNVEFSTVGEVKFNSSTSLTVSISESGGNNKKSNLTVTNPDGGSVTCVECVST